MKFCHAVVLETGCTDTFIIAKKQQIFWTIAVLLLSVLCP